MPSNHLGDSSSSTRFRASIGAWLNLTDPFAAFSLGSAGYDWLCVDEQHGGAVPAVTPQLISGAGDTEVLVRVAWNRSELIGRALDSGARGVIVPMVQSATEAADAAASCRYPPRGGRSWGPSRVSYTAAGTGIDDANARVACFVMIETPEAVEQAKQIAAVPGVDGIFVGPFDLSIALGMHIDEMVADTSDTSPLSRVVAACRASGITAGAYAGSVERAAALRTRGFEMLAVTSDSDLLASGARTAAAAARATLG